MSEFSLNHSLPDPSNQSRENLIKGFLNQGFIKEEDNRSSVKPEGAFDYARLTSPETYERSIQQEPIHGAKEIRLQFKGQEVRMWANLERLDKIKIQSLVKFISREISLGILLALVDAFFLQSSGIDILGPIEGFSSADQPDPWVRGALVFAIVSILTAPLLFINMKKEQGLENKIKEALENTLKKSHSLLP